MLSHRRRAAPLAAGVVGEHDGVPTAAVDLPEPSCPNHTDDTSLIAAALSHLKPEHRLVIVRAYYRGESVAELAAALDVPPGTVKSRLHHGLRALRRALQENGVTGLHHEQLC